MSRNYLSMLSENRSPICAICLAIQSSFRVHGQIQVGFYATYSESPRRLGWNKFQNGIFVGSRGQFFALVLAIAA